MPSLTSLFRDNNKSVQESDGEGEIIKVTANRAIPHRFGIDTRPELLLNNNSLRRTTTTRTENGKCRATIDILNFCLGKLFGLGGAKMGKKNVSFNCAA